MKVASASRRSFVSAVSVWILIAAVSGVYGFVYEVIFYYLNSGMQTVYWRGSHFLPWINIYALGGVMIHALTRRLTRHPALVVLVSGLGCGVLEYATGAVLFYAFGTRGWDYNTEILNFGNIGGFICLRSVLIFALSGLLLAYAIVPLIHRLQDKLSEKAFAILAVTILAVLLLDQGYNSLIAPCFENLTTANDLYTSLGLPTIAY